MPLDIQHCPTLYGEAAERFFKQASENLKKKGTVDNSEQIAICNSILEKANLKH